MKTVWKVVGIAMLVAILGIAAVGAVAYAQDDDEGYPFDFTERFKSALAEILGISVEEYAAAVEQAQDQVVDEALAEGWLTEEQAELLQFRLDQGPGLGMRGLGKGLGGLDYGLGRGGISLTSIAADQLGMSLTELLTALQDGQSIAAVAAEKGVDTQVIVDAYLAEIKEDVDEAVAEGRITQKQADYYLEQATERATNRLDDTWEGDSRGGGRHGGMMGVPGSGGL